ncbi:MAG: hypothetical protein JNK24_05300 [Alphaproteobacteria bacterium]|nr:hypothetical protein [Alphaproteobacteria bacterium]
MSLPLQFVDPPSPLLPLKNYPELCEKDTDYLLNIYALHKICMHHLRRKGPQSAGPLEIAPQAFTLLSDVFYRAAHAKLESPEDPAIKAHFDAAHWALLDIAYSEHLGPTQAKGLLIEFYQSSIGGKLFETLCTLYKEAKAMLAQNDHNLIALHQRDTTADALNRLAGLGKGEISIRATAVLSGADSVVVAIAPAPAPPPAAAPAAPMPQAA